MTSAEIQQLGKVHVQSGDLICQLYWNQPDVKFEVGITTELQDTLADFAIQHGSKLRGKQVEYFVMVRPAK